MCHSAIFYDQNSINNTNIMNFDNESKDLIAAFQQELSRQMKDTEKIGLKTVAITRLQQHIFQ